VTWEVVEDGVHQSAIGRVELEAGTPITLELRSGTSTLRADLQRPQDRFAESERFWTGWASKLDLPAMGRDAVERSALTLKAMCHGPTGAVVSAMTTSLPRSLGGVRNWDQRYCWLREAAMSVQALARLGSPEEAVAYLGWLARLLETRSDSDRLAPLYNVTGRHLQPEASISELPGYGGSRPVRVGNAAIGQVQYDMFGPIVELVWTLHQTGQEVASEHWRLVEEMVLAVSRRWHQPDHGFWQLRTGTRHHLHTKVSCWTAADRAIQLADRFLDRAPEAWIELRDQIADEVLDRCWNPTIGSFTASYDSLDLDGTVLSVGLSGLLPGDDDRFRSTVAAVERNLRVGSAVLRYRADDGLPGKVGAAPVMAFWLVEALCLTGDIDRAGSLFDQAASQTGVTGIYTDSFDPDSGRHLGNLPSGRSHVGLINSALRLDTTR
jgi:GH15 family glucan-1,4-alpha-glucosidase